MKKITPIVFYFICVFINAQDFATNKFQVGVSYALNAKEGIFKNPYTLNVQYQFKNWEKINAEMGLRTFFYQTTNKEFYPNKFGLNPNLSISKNYIKNKLNLSFALGYYLDFFKSESTIIGMDISPERNVYTSGATLSPAIKYLFFKSFYLEANYIFILASTNDVYYKNIVGNNYIFNTGIGITF